MDSERPPQGDLPVFADMGRYQIVTAQLDHEGPFRRLLAILYSRGVQGCPTHPKAELLRSRRVLADIRSCKPIADRAGGIGTEIIGTPFQSAVADSACDRFK